MATDKNATFAAGMGVQLAGIIALAVGIGLRFTVMAVIGCAMILGSGAVQLYLFQKWGLSDYTRLPGRRVRPVPWGEVVFTILGLGLFVFAVLSWQGVVAYEMYQPRQSVVVGLAMALMSIGSLLMRLSSRLLLPMLTLAAAMIALLSLFWIDG